MVIAERKNPIDVPESVDTPLWMCDGTVDNIVCMCGDCLRQSQGRLLKSCFFGNASFSRTCPVQAITGHLITANQSLLLLIMRPVVHYEGRKIKQMAIMPAFVFGTLIDHLALVLLSTAAEAQNFSIKAEIARTRARNSRRLFKKSRSMADK